jgi:hypothetical protein
MIDRTLRHNPATSHTVFIVALLVTTLLVMCALVWYMSPRLHPIVIGSVADFPPSVNPYRVTTQEYMLYIVNTGDMLIALDARATADQYPNMARMNVIWVDANGRYEDPLTASRYTLMGDYLYGPANRGLDRYETRIVDGVIEVLPWRVIRGAPAVEPRLTALPR